MAQERVTPNEQLRRLVAAIERAMRADRNGLHEPDNWLNVIRECEVSRSIMIAAPVDRAWYESAMFRAGYHRPPSIYRDGTYRDTCYSAGWDAWQAACRLEK